jgi:hypothetical protein
MTGGWRIMGNFKGTLIALALLVALGAYIKFFEKGPVADPNADQGEKIFKKAVADVQGLSVEYPLDPSAKPVSVVMDESGKWKLTSPDAMQADESSVRNLLSAVSEGHVLTQIKSPKNLADYGLSSPNAKGSFRFKDGSTFQVEVGDKNVNATATYIHVTGSPDVLLVPNDAVEWFKKKFSDFRNRKVFAVSEATSRKVRITQGSSHISLEKLKDGQWTFLEPKKESASADLVRQFLSVVDNIQVSEFPDDHPASLAKYGLSHPRAVLEVWESENAKPKILMVGNERKSDHKIFIKDASLSYVYLVNPEMAKSIESKKPGDFKPKDLMQFTADSVKKLVLRRGGRVFTYNKDAGGSWSSKERPAAASEAPGVLAPLATTLVLDYADRGADTGLEHPGLTAEVTLMDGKTHVYKYGKRIGPDKVYLASDQGPDVLVVASYILTQMEAVFNAPIQPAVTKKK